MAMHGYVVMAMYEWLCMYGYVWLCMAMYVWLCMAMYLWLCMYGNVSYLSKTYPLSLCAPYATINLNRLFNEPSFDSFPLLMFVSVWF